MNTTIDTYCHRELITFKSLKAAKKFYFEAMLGTEGSESERYREVYGKLYAGEAPFCDCDGVPENTVKTKATIMTAEDEEKAWEIVRERSNAAANFDNLRAQLALKKAEFEKENAELLSNIKFWGDKRNSLDIELIKYERKGFRQ